MLRKASKKIICDILYVTMFITIMLTMVFVFPTSGYALGNSNISDASATNAPNTFIGGSSSYYNVPGIRVDTDSRTMIETMITPVNGNYVRLVGNGLIVGWLSTQGQWRAEPNRGILHDWSIIRMVATPGPGMIAGAPGNTHGVSIVSNGLVAANNGRVIIEAFFLSPFSRHLIGHQYNFHGQGNHSFRSY